MSFRGFIKRFAININTVSTIPPIIPDNAPIINPIRSVKAADINPTKRTSFDPTTNCLKVSLPPKSVPNRCCKDGP